MWWRWLDERDREREVSVRNGRATMRCDRAAMSCGRPRWSRSDPCTPRVQPRPRHGSSYRPIHLLLFFFFFSPPGKSRAKLRFPASARAVRFDGCASTGALFNHLRSDCFAFFSFQGAVACILPSFFFLQRGLFYYTDTGWAYRRNIFILFKIPF